MVGSLKLVGERKWTADDLEAALERARPHGVRPGRPAGRTLSDAGRLSSRSRSHRMSEANSGMRLL